jgi:Ca-activated chloride channel family protein
MTLLRPDFGPWALLVPAIVIGWTLYRLSRRAFARRLAVAARFAGLSKRSSGWRDGGVLIAGVVAAAAIVAALVRPQARVTHRTPEFEREDLIIMLDRSVSMRAHDVRPSRAARATLEIRNFIRHKPEGIDRVALVGFSDTAVVLSYLTDDVDSVLFYFDWIDTDHTTLLGTNIGAALTSAVEIAQKDERPSRKVFLLVSDGEDYGTELTRAVADAKAHGYQVNCVGIGGDRAVPIPVSTADGGETPLRDDSGRPITTRFEEATLRAVAAATGGQYVRSASGEELRRAIASLAAGERRIVGWRESTERRDLYPVCLGLAALAGAVLVALW